ncbi:MAG: DedA family protein [Streptosporangiales bacterium]|nr:DedA family protein [Streptosporangiales bacterium]MBO0891806.1 DedA family protein [Acidothermales bacterium]
MKPLLVAFAAQPLLAVDILPGWLDPQQIIPAVGLAGVLAIIFVECGLFCFFLPGDSLLFTAGLFATHTGVLFHAQQNLAVLLITTPIAAVAGAQLGHLLGARFGRRLFERDGRLIKRAYLERAEEYFDRFGPARTVVLGRFIPIVRSFVNPVAGILEMSARRFFLWNVAIALVWADGLVLVGYFLGRTIPGVDRYLLPAIALIVVASVTPAAIEIVKARRSRRRAARHSVKAERQSP